MAKTVGDLFIRVTAKDQQFQKGMRRVQGSIKSTVGVASRLAGVFGMAFGVASLISKTIESSAKYSGEFAKQMAKMTYQSQMFWMAAGKQMGPVFAEILEDFNKMVFAGASWTAIWAEVASYARELYTVLKPIIWFLNAQQKGLKILGEGIGGTAAKLMPSYSRAYSRRGLDKKDLERLRADDPSTVSIDSVPGQRHGQRGPDDYKHLEVLKQIANNTEGPR